ncbi:MAG: aminopeptidase P family protein [Rhodospirillaceae bacterium]|nr:aminopeptidase P family protein [Rhodospirillaceae bacterium]
MERRLALTAAFGATGIGMIGTAQAAAGASAGIPNIPKLPAPIVGPRMNFAQADKVMALLGLDAIIVGGGTNLYHATGLDLSSPKMGHTPSVFAVITRNEKQRLSLIAPAFLYYYNVALESEGLNVPVYVYTSKVPGVMENGEPKAAPFETFPDRKAAKFDFIESTRKSVVEATFAKDPAKPNAESAMRAALKDLGLMKGRIAVDHIAISKAMAEAAPEASVVDADDALRRIRPVKSAVEIELMRQAAFNNAEAAKEAVKVVRAGADVRELRANFFAAAALRGHRGVFMVIDRVSSPTYSAKFRDGQCFSIDCVSEYMGYHGDYARAVFVGEPPAAMKKVTDATGKAWDIVRENLKPGLKFSDVREIGKKALKGLNVDYNISFTPHSVGLYHSDHVGNTGLPPVGDMVLEPGMVLSVDCPLLESGAGGSSHLEDLTLITKDGFENLNDISGKTIVV